MPLRNNIMCIDPGVKGGIAWTNYEGELFSAPNPEPPPKTKTMRHICYQVSRIQSLLKLIAETNCGMDFQVFIEHVAFRRSDTPKTAARLNSNYALWLSGCYQKWGRNVKLVMPVVWQNQLPIEIPSGTHNYKARKKVLENFAKERVSDGLRQISCKSPGNFKEKRSQATQKTADALCMLWVYAEMEL